MRFLVRFLPIACFCLLPTLAAAQNRTEAPPALKDTPAIAARLAELEAQPPATAQNAALYYFKLEQARLLVQELRRLAGWEPADYVRAANSVLERAATVGAATNDAASTNAILQERAYIAANDGSSQPYWVALPPNYTPVKRYPLLVFLHGYSTDVSKLNPWMPPLEVVEAAQRRGFILAIPYGRRNTDFVQVGEDDLFTVRREVERLFSVDPNRVLLTGASMGGYGVWAAGLHTPGAWAALAPVCGRTDMYLWFKLERDKVPAWKQLLYDADDPRTLLTNMRAFPAYVQHGANDIVVPVDHSRRIAADGRKLRLPLIYREDPKGDHWYEFQINALDSAFAWAGGVRQLPPPREFSFTTGDLKEAKGYWAQIEALEDYSKTGRLDIKIENGSILNVRTTNVSRFVLTPPASILKAGRQLALKVNGLESPDLFDPAKPVVWQKPDAKTSKSPAHCGPYKNAFRDPFLLVYGDVNDQMAALLFRQEWWVYADGWPPMKSAAQVTEEDKATKNLILFGTRATNPLLAEIGDQLPVELTPDGYRIGDKQVAGKDLGLRMVWRSPWNADRLITVQSGSWWGEKLPVNHKWDLVPDYIVYGKEIDPVDSTNVPLAAGYFDGDWKLLNALN
jgi:poly(3-hydroxybutyrate) depolymerase